MCDAPKSRWRFRDCQVSRRCVVSTARTRSVCRPRMFRAGAAEGGSCSEDGRVSDGARTGDGVESGSTHSERAHQERKLVGEQGELRAVRKSWLLGLVVRHGSFDRLRTGFPGEFGMDRWGSGWWIGKEEGGAPLGVGRTGSRRTPRVLGAAGSRLRTPGLRRGMLGSVGCWGLCGSTRSSGDSRPAHHERGG